MDEVSVGPVAPLPVPLPTHKYPPRFALVPASARRRGRPLGAAGSDNTLEWLASGGEWGMVARSGGQ